MANQVTNYKCPACTGPLHFVGESGKLECDYCGSVYEVSYIENMMAEAEGKAEEAFNEAEVTITPDDTAWDTTGISDDWGAEAANLKVYNCPSCGAELICDSTTAATSCPYCGNPTIVPGQFSGVLKPDYVLPFKLDKDAAIKALKEHYQGKRFLPKSFTDKNHIEEIKGVYVPFWLYDGVADADLRFEATRSMTHREGQYNVTTTEHFMVRRAGSIAFENVPVDASSKMPDDHMDSIEPYDYADLKPFSTAYLPGYLADKYDQTADECAARADERCKTSVVGAVSSTVMGYESVLPVGENVSLHRGKVKYALMPVWLLNTKWNGKDFLFAMNGQTGKLVGDLPVDKGRFWTTFAAIAVPIAAVLAFILLR